MTNDLIYVYCITRTQLSPLDDIEFEDLRTIVIDDFQIFIKYVSASDFSEENLKKHLSDILWLESNVRVHIKVISRIMQVCDVIPFKFGTIFNSDEGLQKFVNDYAESLNENFHSIQGKEEWSVKIYCDRKMLSDQIDVLSEDAAILEMQIMASSPGKAFLLKRKKTDLIEYEMDRLCKKYGQEYFDELNNLSEMTSLNNLLPKEFTGRDHTMILNATFFIDKMKVTDFINIVGKLKNKDQGSGFFIEESGPWPPFSFISIKEKS